MPTSRTGSGETPRVGEPTGERLARLEECQRGSDRRADERHGELLAACHEATKAAREASATASEVGRNVASLTTTVGRIDKRLYDVERDRRSTGPYSAVPEPVRTGSTEPITIGTHPIRVPTEQEDGTADVAAGLRRKHTGMLATIATIVATAVVSAITAVWAIMRGGGKG